MILAIVAMIFVWASPQEAQELKAAYRNLRQITNDERYYNYDVEIGPEGKQIIYASDRTDRYGDIVIQPLVGSTQIQKTFYEGTDRNPTFSPDGTMELAQALKL